MNSSLTTARASCALAYVRRGSDILRGISLYTVLTERRMAAPNCFNNGSGDLALADSSMQSPHTPSVWPDNGTLTLSTLISLNTPEALNIVSYFNGALVSKPLSSITICQSEIQSTRIGLSSSAVSSLNNVGVGSSIMYQPPGLTRLKVRSRVALGFGS
jgi:hypothetical protein